MIIAIVTFFMSLLGIGSVDVFYVDKIEEGINKEIKDKDRKKELKAELADYSKEVKKFNKTFNKEVNILKNKNLDKNTSETWYEAYFVGRMEERKELQKLFIEDRIKMQELIKDDEWAQIMNRATDATTKEQEKADKKAKNKKDKNLFESTEDAINEKFVDDEKLAENIEALEFFETEYNNIAADYENINVNESVFLTDKNATREEMIALSELLNIEREKMYLAYTNFLMVLRNNSNEEQYQYVVKKFNKATN